MKEINLNWGKKSKFFREGEKGGLGGDENLGYFFYFDLNLIILVL